MVFSNKIINNFLNQMKNKSMDSSASWQNQGGDKNNQEVGMFSEEEA